MSDYHVSEYYQVMKNQFPYSHFVFATIVSSQSYRVGVHSNLDPDCFETPSEELHRKERMILFFFLGLIRTRNRLLLRHYGMVEPLAVWFKGQQQSGRRTLSGGFHSTLPTVFRKMNDLYEKCLLTFNAKLRGEIRCHGAFDNHNKQIRNKNKNRWEICNQSH